MSNSLCFSNETTLLQKKYKTWYCMPPSPDDAAQSGGENEKKQKAAVRPRAVGLLIGIECSRIRDNSWMYLTSLVTIRIGVVLAAVQRKLPDVL